jgi:hypothetical protein
VRTALADVPPASEPATAATAEPLRLYGKIPRHEPGLLTQALAPLLWMKAALDDLRDAVIQMIWGELTGQRAEHDQWLHLAAFAVFSAFCLLAYAGFEDGMVLFLYALWPLDYVAARAARSDAHQDRVSLRQEGSTLVWQRLGRGVPPCSERFPLAQVRAVRVRWVDDAVGAYGSVRVRNWEVYLVLHGEAEHVLGSEPAITRALKRASDLAGRLGVPVLVEHSNGQGPLAEVQTPPLWDPDRLGQWRAEPARDGVGLRTGPRTLDHGKLGRRVLEEAGSFLLLAVMAGFMTRYGTFLAWMWGPSLGLVEPFPLELDLSLTGFLSLFTPDQSVETVVVLTLTVAAVAGSLWRHAQPRRLVVSGRGLSYEVRGRTVAALAGRQVHSVLLLHTPEPALVVAAPDGRALLVDDLYDGECQEELYAHLVRAIDDVWAARSHPPG